MCNRNSRLGRIQFYGSLILLTACRTLPPLPPVNLADPGWHIQQGQAVWRPRLHAPELAGDLLVATNLDGRILVQFTKTPVPFVVAQATSNTWQIQWVPQNKTYSGQGEPPRRLSWLYLPQCLSGHAVKSLELVRLAQGQWRLSNSISGETLEGFLSNSR